MQIFKLTSFLTTNVLVYRAFSMTTQNGLLYRFDSAPTVSNVVLNRKFG